MSTTTIYIALAVCLAVICVALMVGGEIRRVGGVRRRGSTVFGGAGGHRTVRKRATGLEGAGKERPK